MSILSTQHGGSHYVEKKIQPIEYITANDLDYCEGAVVKYVTRHESKGKDLDILKAIHHLQYILKYTYGYTDEQMSNSKNTDISGRDNPPSN